MQENKKCVIIEMKKSQARQKGEDKMKKVLDFFFNDRYFSVDEKMGFWENFFFDHYIDEDVNMMWRKGLTKKFRILVGVTAVLLLSLLI